MAETDPVEPVEIVPAPEVPKPRPRTSKLTATLVILNLLAAVGLAFLAVLDAGKRHEWAKAILLRDLATVGLPVDDKDLGTNPEAGAQPNYSLDPAYIREIYKARGGSAADKFMAVNENFKVHVRVTDLDENVLAAHFAGAGKPVPTIKGEIETLKNQLPGDIDDAARQAADKVKDKSAPEKRALLRKVLYPLCGEGSDVVLIEKKITNTPDGKLDEFLVAALQRRILFDILQPLEVFRPTAAAPEDEALKEKDPKFTKLLVNRAADLDGVSVDDLKELLRKRCADVLADRHWSWGSMPRDNLEKRRAAAFLLLVASQIEIPSSASGAAIEKKAPQPPQDQKDQDKNQGGDQVEKQQVAEPTARQSVFPRFTQRRVEAVCGVRAFTQACEDYAIVTEYMERQAIDSIQRDLGNYQYPLTTRYYQTNKFSDELIAAMSRMKITPMDAAGFRKSVEDKLSTMQGKYEGSGQVVEELKKLMEAGGLQLTGADAIAFEREVDALLSANAIGFLGKYQMLLKRTQDLAMLVKRQERQLAELKDIHDERVKQLATRGGQEKLAQEELVQARAKTRELALRLRDKQQELFLAHAYLRGGIEYNLYLEQLLQKVERGKGGNAP